MNFYKSIVTKKIIFFLYILLINSCKNEVVDIMPYVQFQQTLSPGEVTSMGVYDAILKDGGYAGLVVFKNADNEFLAFERLCTYYPNDTSAVVLDKSKLTATCPKCKSAFSLILDGARTSGPARLQLRKYNCFMINGRLTISN